jgi:hypothetical protein
MRRFHIFYDFDFLYGEGSVVTILASSQKEAVEKWLAEMDDSDRRAGAHVVEIREVVL